MRNSMTLIFGAWLIAVIALFSTLYGSEILGFAVCHLCWYQRICIYPLVITLGIGAFQNDIRCAVYGLPLCVLGAFFALYQYLEQMIPGFAPLSFCVPQVPCSTTHMMFLGFVTYPLLSLLACLLMAALLITAMRVHHKNP